MSSHDWLVWAAYAFFALALSYLGESFWWNTHFLETLWMACLISSGIFATAAISTTPASLGTAKVRSRR
jgi:hypothetical protein